MTDTTVQKPSVYYDEEEGRWWYRASALNRCNRELVAARCGVQSKKNSELGLKPGTEPPWLAEGNLHEKDIIEKLRGLGWAAEGTQKTVRLRATVPYGQSTKHRSTKVGIIGHMDLLAWTSDEGPYLGEVKSLGKNRWDELNCGLLPVGHLRKIVGARHVPLQLRNSLGDEFGYQFSAYHHGLKGLSKGVLLCVKNRDTGAWFGVKMLPPPERYLWGRVEAIENMAWQRQQKKDPWPACNRNQFPCPYAHIHDQKKQAAPKLTTAIAEQISLTAAERQRTIDHHKEEMAAFEDQLDTLLEEAETDSVTVDEWTVYRREPHTQEQVDTKRLKEQAEQAGIELPTKEKKVKGGIVVRRNKRSDA